MSLNTDRSCVFPESHSTGCRGEPTAHAASAIVARGMWLKAQAMATSRVILAIVMVRLLMSAPRVVLHTDGSAHAAGSLCLAPSFGRAYRIRRARAVIPVTALGVFAR